MQYAPEASFGVDVPTTRLFLGDVEWNEELEFYRDMTPRGIAATPGGVGIITHRGTTLKLGGNIGCQYIMLPLLSGLRNVASPTGAGADKTWTFARSSLAVSNPTLDSFTFEKVESDGTTNHIAVACHAAMCTRLGIQVAKGEPMKWNSDWFARATLVETLTAAITAQANHDASMIMAESVKVYLDTTYAGIGTTQLVGVVVSADLDLAFATKQVQTIDGTTNLDYVTYKNETLGGTFKLTMELNAVSAALITSWRANTAQYFRIKGTGAALGASNYSVQFDFAARYTGSYGISADGENVIVSLDMELIYDTTGAQIVTAVVVNDLAARANL